MRKWILFGALILGLVELELALEQWADQAVGGSPAPIQEGPYPAPTPVPTPSPS